MNRARSPTLLLFALAVWLVSAFRPPALGAQAAPSPMLVDITLVGRAAEEPELAERIASWFTAERFHVEVRRTSELEPESVLRPEPTPGLRVWVNLKGTALARLY